MDSPQIIGFAASVVLLATLASQVWKQWSSGRSEGVSPWLFVGQAIANVGMLAYSIMLRDMVFIVTNSATLATSCVGFVVQRIHARRTAAKNRGEHPPSRREAPPWRRSLGEWERIEATVGPGVHVLHALQLGDSVRRTIERPLLRLVTDE